MMRDGPDQHHLEEIWERPVGLTAEDAISITDEEEYEYTSCVNRAYSSSSDSNANLHSSHRGKYSMNIPACKGAPAIMPSRSGGVGETPLCDETTTLQDEFKEEEKFSSLRPECPNKLEEKPSKGGHIQRRDCCLGSFALGVCHETATRENPKTQIENRASPKSQHIDEDQNPFTIFAYLSDSVTRAPASIMNNDVSDKNSVTVLVANKRKSESSGEKSYERLNENSNSIVRTCKRWKESPFSPYDVFSPNQLPKQRQMSPEKLLTKSAQNLRNHHKEQIQPCRLKWQSFSDPNAPLEIRRFQVLVAARLHARCQERVVRNAMKRLRNHFSRNTDNSSGFGANRSSFDDVTPLSPNISQAQKKIVSAPVVDLSRPNLTSIHKRSSDPRYYLGLTPYFLAQSNSDDISALLTSVNFGNVKARQIIRAAQDIMEKFGGEVPETAERLKEITGIGPKLAEILSLVNQKDSYV